VSPTTSIRKSHCKCTPFQNGKVLTKNLCIASYRRIYILDKQERFLFLSILWCTNKTVQRLVGSLQSLQYSRQLEMRHVTKTAVCRSAERQTSGLHVLVISKKNSTCLLDMCFRSSCYWHQQSFWRNDLGWSVSSTSARRLSSCHFASLACKKVLSLVPLDRARKFASFDTFQFQWFKWHKTSKMSFFTCFVKERRISDLLLTSELRQLCSLRQ